MCDFILLVMLESRGLPPHLLGSLGPRIPHFFHKHMSSSNSKKDFICSLGLI